MNNFLKLEYPYYSLYTKLNKKDILNKIKEYKPTIYNNVPNNLKNSKFHLQKFNGNYFIIKEDYLKTLYINNITDYFSEINRVKCKFGNYPIPLDYWTNNKKDIIQKTLQKYHKVTIHNLREIIYQNTKLCNNFRITVGMTLLNYFKPKSWLDMSAGWGDRLLSAIFCKIKYYEATDPNLDMHSCYNSMIETFVPKTRHKNYIIHKNGFLEANIKKTNFDIVFTSPPFFTLEIYSKHNENSVVKFSTETDWINNFLIKSLIKSYNLLKAGGHMILYMGGSKEVMSAMYKLSNIMEYLGIIYFYEKTPRGIYVWKKKNDKKLMKITEL